MNPITRKEMFLAAAGGQDVTTPTPITREEVSLDEIAKGGGSSLPSTETASAGDVLSLDDNKEPQWAAPSGSGGGAFVVNLTINTGTKTTTADKTAAEIWAAAQSGCVVFTGSNAYLGQDGTFVRPIMEASHTEFGYVFMFGNAFDSLVAATGSDYPTGTLF